MIVTIRRAQLRMAHWSASWRKATYMAAFYPEF
jgi:hypothetical protein